MTDKKKDSDFEEIALKVALNPACRGGRQRGARKGSSGIEKWQQRKSSFECTYKETLDSIANSRCDHDDNASGAGELARDNYLTCEVDQVSGHFETALSMIEDGGNNVQGWLNDIEREISSSEEQIQRRLDFLLETCKDYQDYLQNKINQLGKSTNSGDAGIDVKIVERPNQLPLNRGPNALPAQVKLLDKYDIMGELITLLEKKDFKKFGEKFYKVVDVINEHRKGCDFVNTIRRLLSLLSQYFSIFKIFKSQGEQCMDKVGSILTNNKLAFFNHPTGALERRSTDDSVIVDSNEPLIVTSTA